MQADCPFGDKSRLGSGPSCSLHFFFMFFSATLSFPFSYLVVLHAAPSEAEWMVVYVRRRPPQAVPRLSLVLASGSAPLATLVRSFSVQSHSHDMWGNLDECGWAWKD